MDKIVQEKFNINSICTKCEYSIPVDHIHNYKYTPNNDNRTHTVSCSCGDLFDQYCIGNTNGPIGTLCIKCKQIIGGPTEIPILYKKKDSPL